MTFLSLRNFTFWPQQRERVDEKRRHTSGVCRLRNLNIERIVLSSFLTAFIDAFHHAEYEICDATALAVLRLKWIDPLFWSASLPQFLRKEVAPNCGAVSFHLESLDPYISRKCSRCWWANFFSGMQTSMNPLHRSMWNAFTFAPKLDTSVWFAEWDDVCFFLAGATLPVKQNSLGRAKYLRKLANHSQIKFALAFFPHDAQFANWNKNKQKSRCSALGWKQLLYVLYANIGYARFGRKSLDMAVKWPKIGWICLFWPRYASPLESHRNMQNLHEASASWIWVTLTGGAIEVTSFQNNVALADFNFSLISLFF